MAYMGNVFESMQGQPTDRGRGNQVDIQRDQWDDADPNTRSWRYFDDPLKRFYNDNKNAAFGQWLDDSAGFQQTPLRAYLQQNFNRSVQEYYRANEQNPNLMYTDTLSGGWLDKLRQSFQMQSPSVKGYAIQHQAAGRYTG